MLHMAEWDDIVAGRVTDVYFQRTLDTIRQADLDKHVSAEITASSFPDGYQWAIFAGVEAAVELLEELDCDAEALPEGGVFYPGEPVVRLTGMYTSFCVYETALLGFLCQASGIATRAARCKLAAGDRPVISFGARRMHPAMAPMIERNAYVGGCDGFAVIATSDALGIPPSGTMPHALVLVAGDLPTALKAFDEAVPGDVDRVALVDTFDDEKFASLLAAETLGEKLSAVRLDTPGNRRGDFADLAKEVRWELDRRGYDNVDIFMSGGLDEYSIPKLNEIADGYGVGTSISNAPTIDFALDIIEIEGEPMAKRGKLSGRKAPMRCKSCSHHWIAPADGDATCPECGAAGESALQQVTESGDKIVDLPGVTEIREFVIQQISGFENTFSKELEQE